MNNFDWYGGESLDDLPTKFPGLVSLINELADWGFPASLFNSLVEGYTFSLSGLASGSKAYFKDSIHTNTAGYRCFLEFADDVADFYIIIHYCPIAIYIPKFKIFINLYKIYETSIEDLVRDFSEVVVKRDKELLNNYSLTKNFNGLLLRSNRPFHYFFELEYGLWNLYKSGFFKNRKLKYYVNPDESFFPFWDIPAFAGLLETFNNPLDFNSKLRKEEGVVIPVFLPVAYARVKNLKRINEELREPDALIVEHSVSICQSDIEYSAFQSTVSDDSLTLWFGICSEKRRWHEQVQLITKVVSYLAAKGYKITVVLDGMTGTMSNNKKYRRDPTPFDTSVVEEIKKSLSNVASFITLLNAKSWLKLAIAKKSDFFISHHMTDSIFISRFAGVPGITHQSKNGTLVESPQYRHDFITKIPSEWIVDDNNNNGRPADTSYSISLDQAFPFVIERLESILAIT